MADDQRIDPVAPQDEGPTTVIRQTETTEEQQAEMDKRMVVDAFIQRATTRWTLANESEELQRRRSLEEVEFDSGKHWDEGMKKEREEKQRVVIEINRTPQYLNQVANEEKIARPAINVVPTGYGSDPQTANVKAGMIRSIEKRSGAEGIRDDAFYRMLQKGWAYYRINDEYENERSFRRVIRTREIANDFSVYCDPNARAFTREDAKFYFIVDDMPVDEYRAEYPDSKLASLTEMTSLGDQIKDWIGKDTIRVAEYFYKIAEPMKLYALPSDDPADSENYIGKFEDELTAIDRTNLITDSKGMPVVRMSVREKVYWAKINAVEVLEGNENLTGGRQIMSKFIPIVFLPGRKIRVEGKDLYVGMVRDAMDPCLASDYWMSAITEMVALAPKTPWVAPSKGIENYREEWRRANIENFAVLEYDHIDESGQVIPPPTRQQVNPPIEAMTRILQFADDDLKRVMGIYNASLGAPGPETSGVAIRNRQSESDIANYNYIDNLKRTIYFESQVYLDMMPRIYDQPQMVEITRPDGTTQLQAINKVVKDESGEMKKYDMTRITYDAIVEVGASYETKREQAAQMINDYLQIDPTAAPLVGDLLARNMDNPDRLEFERRLKSRVPPEILRDDLEDEGEPIPPKFKAQYDNLAKMLEQTTDALKKLQDEMDTESMKHQQKMEYEKLKLESEERRAAQQSQVDLAGFASKSDLELMKGLMQMIMAQIAAGAPGSAEGIPAPQPGVTAPAAAPAQPAPQPGA